MKKIEEVGWGLFWIFISGGAVAVIFYFLVLKPVVGT